MHFIFCLIDRDGVSDLRQNTKAEEDAYLAKINERIFFGGTLLSDDRSEAKGSFYVIEFDNRAAAEAWLAGSPLLKAHVYRQATIRGYTHAVPKDGLADSVDHGLWAYIQLDVPHGQDLRRIHIDAHIDFLLDTADDIFSDGPLYWDNDATEFEHRLGSVFVVDFPDRENAENWRLAEPFTVEGVYGTLWAYAYENEWPRN